MIDLQLPFSPSPIVNALVGGVFTGVGALLLLLRHGRVFVISGITAYKNI